jgi:O-antigen ligase
MPETIKSLIIILVLGSFILHFHKKNLPKIISSSDINQWQFLWIASSCAAFLSYNYWLFVLAITSIIKLRSNNDKAAQFICYIWLLPLLPLLEKDIPGLGGIRFIFELNFPRLLSLTILLPLFLTQSDKKLSFFHLPGDKILSLYLLVSILLTSRNGEITNIFRSNFYLFIDIFLPYYAASRALVKFHDFRQFAFAFFTSVSILAIIALFEMFKGWHLYSSLSYSLDIPSRFSSYLFRDGLLRATGPFSSSIILGYVLTIGLGMGVAISSTFQNRKWLLLLFLLYGLALLATASRGPWVGAFLLYLTFVFLNHNKTKVMRQGAIAATVFSPLLFFTSYGQKIIQLLPFIGQSHDGTISYRQELFEKSWIVIQRHPFFGSNTYLDTPEMQSMIQGQGIIDIVNSYLRIALNSGFIGVGLFMMFFFGLLFKLYRAQRKIPRSEPEIHLFAIALIATLVNILFIIATVSSIDIVSQLYWIIAGIISAYIHFLKLHNYRSRIQ